MKRILGCMIILLFVVLTIPGLSQGADAVFGMTSKGITRAPHIGMVEKAFGAPRMHNMRSYWKSHKQYSSERKRIKGSLKKQRLNNDRLHEYRKSSNPVSTIPD